MDSTHAKRAALLFWRSCGLTNATSYNNKFANSIICATDGACTSLKTLLAATGAKNASLARNYFAALIFAHTPNDFTACIENLLESSLMESHALFSYAGGEIILQDCNSSRCMFISFWKNMHELDWCHFFNAAVLKVFYRGIDCCVFGLCSAKYDSPMLNTLNRWKESVLLPWLEVVEGRNCRHKGNRQFLDSRGIDSLWCLVNLVVDESYVRARVKELYDIIADFPESICAVTELRNALSRTQQHQLLAHSLRLTLQRRLLHSGANSSQIIDVYISAIKVLRILDPDDSLLDVVACPIRMYLQSREDTVRCIVTNLTDQDSGELYEQLHKTTAPQLDCINDSDDEHSEPGGDWVPRSKKSPLTKRRSMGDILSMLISIYGSKEVFVNEYRYMLADKLIAKAELHETRHEVKNLELLKLRFGETSLHHCEIMLRDVEESKRLNKRVPDNFLRATVISQVFWPALSDDELIVHPRVGFLLESFARMYNTLKAPRKVVWKKQVGIAQLELDFGAGIKKEIDVSLIHATIILHFHGCDVRNLHDLTSVTNISEESMRNKITFWVNHGVIQEISPGLFSVTSSLQISSNPVSLLDEDVKHANIPLRQSQHDDAILYCPYIIGVLTNVGQLSLKRLHNLLRFCMCRGNEKHDVSPQQFATILEQLCKSRVIEHAQGFYKLPS